MDSKEKRQVNVAMITLIILVFFMILVVLVVVFNRDKVSKDIKNELLEKSSSNYVVVNDYEDEVASSFDKFKVDMVEFKDIDSSVTKDFLKEQQEFLNLIDSYQEQLFALENTEGDSNTVEGIVTVTGNDEVISVVYNYTFKLESLDIEESNSFTLNINDKLELMNNEEVFNVNDKLANDVAVKLYDKVVTNFDYNSNVYTDLATGKIVKKSSLGNLKNSYITKLENYVSDIPAYIDKSELVIIYKESDIRKLLFKEDVPKESIDVKLVV